MKLEGARVVVTGGAGFIGSHLVDLLIEKKNSVLVFDDFSSGEMENLKQHQSNPQVQILRGDVRDPAQTLTALTGADVVFHLATHCVRKSLSEPSLNHSVNSTGTLNVLEAARKAQVKRFLYCSSSEVFGSVSNQALREDHPKSPTTLYGASKLYGEQLTQVYHSLYGLPTVIARPFNAYGPRSHWASGYGEVIPRFFIFMKAGRPVPIFGSGKQSRDLTFVEDTARGLFSLMCTDSLLGKTAHVAHGVPISILDLAEKISKVLHVSPQIKHTEERPGDIFHLEANTDLFRTHTGQTLSISIEEGLKRYWNWLSAQNLDFSKTAAQISEKNWEMLEPK